MFRGYVFQIPCLAIRAAVSIKRRSASVHEGHATVSSHQLQGYRPAELYNSARPTTETDLLTFLHWRQPRLGYIPQYLVGGHQREYPVNLIAYFRI